MIDEYYIIFVALILLGIYILFKFLSKLFGKKEIFLSTRLKDRADKKFYKLLNNFKREHRRKPTKNELFMIVVNASHITIRWRGNKGHWVRQKIRKYLLEKHDIVKNYRMR